MKKFSKIFAISMLLAIGASILPVTPNLMPQKARATFPVFDYGNATINWQNLFQNLLEYSMKIAGAEFKKRLLDVIVDNIISWINGEDGKPKFVTDWKGFLNDAGQQAVGDLAKDLNLGFLCQPFSLQVRLSLLPVRKFSQRGLCTLDQIVGNINNFYADFRNGGWLAYSSSWEPQNNIYGSLLLTWTEKNQRVAEAMAVAQNEASAGGGFLSTKSCDEEYGPWPAGQEPGKETDIDHDGNFGDIRDTCKITTPGKTAGDLTSKAFGTGIDYIISAEDLTAYVVAIADAAINKLIIAGASGIQGVKAGPGPAAVPCAGLSGAALQSCLNYLRNSDTSFALTKSLFSDQIQKALPLRQEIQSSITDSLNKLENYTGALRNLLASFNGRSCPEKNTYTNNIQAELNFAASQTADLTNQKNLNQAIIDQLKKASGDIAKLTDGDWDGLSKITNSVGPTVVDIAGNEKLKADLTQQNGDLNTRIAENLQTFNNNLASCP